MIEFLYKGITYIFSDSFNNDDIFFLIKNNNVKNIEKLTRMRKNMIELKCEYKIETVKLIQQLEKNM